jgi:hypothetical protein
MTILKKGGSREKGEEETKSMPHAPVGISLKILDFFNYYFFRIIYLFRQLVRTK